MIRRPASTVIASPGQPTTVTGTGYILGWYVTGTPASGQMMKAQFEDASHGFVSEVPLETVQFQDGSPLVVPTLD